MLHSSRVLATLTGSLNEPVGFLDTADARQNTPLAHLGILGTLSKYEGDLRPSDQESIRAYSG